ncbi:hypothetical protein CPB83DRAFT_893196 [Crepidotus variabilis]|uniref:SnoaL-like domain-containing protein n=1 Tax=Crepidotus variabilis TaxID=179855 RepID=A0A9P6JRF0_9AGAR|nr:hypothetical protein CPB83DRAFT_893196 [Crepidotus variabilis]
MLYTSAVDLWDTRQPNCESSPQGVPFQNPRSASAAIYIVLILASHMALVTGDMLQKSIDDTKIWHYIPLLLPAMTFTRPTNPSPAVSTVLRFVDAAETHDLAAVDKVLSDRSFKSTVHPLTLEHPTTNKAEKIASFKALYFDVLKDHLKVEIMDLIDGGDKVVVHFRILPGSKTHLGHEFTPEYVLICAVAEEDGEWKITRTTEFHDSHYMKDFVGKHTPKH